MVGVLGHENLSQQAGRRDALVDDMGRNRGLDQRFTILTDLLATDVVFNGETARHVIQLFTNVFANALELAATAALRVVRIVLNQGAREFRW